MSFGFTMVLNPLCVLADIVPFVGDIVGIGAGAISGVLAFAGSLVVVAIAWLAVRPLLAGVLIVSAGGAVVYGLVRMRKGRTKMAISGAP